MKRLFDILVSLAVLVVLAPVLIVTAIFVRIFLGGPIFFRQTRTGFGNVPFEVIKFRSMLDLTDANGRYLSDAERLTWFGKMLRSTSVDELPSLWNVLKGDMSIVGPRPQDHRFLKDYSEEQKRRHEVRPGLTGWAQINGRNAIGWEERFKLDVWYVDNQSFRLDIRICLKTVPLVILQHGISAPGHATMPAFVGSEAEQR